MVRLKREMVGLDWDPDRRVPGWIEQSRFRRSMDAEVIAELSAMEWKNGGRVLAVGVAEDVLLWLLQEASHVTVVEPVPAIAQRLQAAIQGRADIRSLTWHAKAYGAISFEANTFDLTVLLDEFNHYADPVNCGRKAARELRIGGRLLSRATLRPPGGEPDGWAMDFEAFQAGTEGVLLVDRVDRHGVATAAVAGHFAGMLPGIRSLGRALLPAARRVDAKLEERVFAERPALAWVEGTKALALGRVFRPGQDPPA
jgi:SAM-dependent methyltransferase